MVTEEFLSLIPGTLGEVSYHKKIFQKVPQKTKDNFVDKFVNAKMNSLLINSRHNLGGSPANVMEEFMKAREMAREELEDRVGVKQDKIYLQVNQRESYERIRKIEKDPLFVRWDFPAFIQMFKESYLESIK